MIIKPMRPVLITLDEFFSIPNLNLDEWMVQTKLDGVRAIWNGEFLQSKSGKPIPNKNLQKYAENVFNKNGPYYDMELWIPNSYFENITSVVMSHEKGIDDIMFMVFDEISNVYNFNVRYESYFNKFFGLGCNSCLNNNKVKPVTCIDRLKREELEFFYKEMIKRNHEGIILRNMYKPYKFGQCRENEQIIYKIKPIDDFEAEVVGFLQEYKNVGESKIDELGYKRKDSKNENKVPINTCGKILCRYKDIEFSVGSGLTDETSVRLWKDRYELIGKMIKVECRGFTSKGKPRQPVYKGFRDEIDM